MLCGISGESPQEPVASKKSGVVYEKRLIEQYISEHGTEPNSGETLSSDDLLPIVYSRIVRPRPPTLTSIPALLATFQNEWDTVALETYNLREQLSRTREELATALYQHDAAVRVIARLTRERDEARASLSKVTVSGSRANGEDEMMIDTTEALPPNLAARVDEVHAELSKSRKKRPVPEGWITPAQISTLKVTATTSTPISQTTTLDGDGDFAALAGLTGDAVIYSAEAEQVVRELAVGEPVTASLWAGTKVIFGTSQGAIKAFKGEETAGSASEHSGATTSLSVHPSGDLIVSVGADKSIVLYDLNTLQRVSRTFADASLTVSAFHPDGHLVAAGTSSGDIKLYMTKTLEQAAVFQLGSPIQALAFSENGFWLAASAKGQSSVTIFDLRKEGEAATAKVLETGGAVQSLAWDYTGQFLATAGPSGLTIQQYAKGGKKWAEPFRSSTPAIAVRWGVSAQKLMTVNAEGVVNVLGPE